MKYAVITFGCRVNQADSLGFEEELLAQGAVPAKPAAADVVIVNTCSVTATADQGARQTIRRLARDNPNARIVVTGCYATRDPEAVRVLPNVARVVSNDDKSMAVPLILRPFESLRVVPSNVEGRQAQDERLLGSLALSLSKGELTTADRGDGEGSCGAAIEPGVAGRTAFTLRVQTGCAEPCSYCIIPTTRGTPRSVPIDSVQREVARVAAAGFKEIALTGVHLGSYGCDLTPGTSLLELLLALEKVAQGLSPAVLFRISSLEPMDCTTEIVDLVARSDRFAPHFHLPLQHASNRVLLAMRRPYTIEQYAALVDGIRARIPNASIGSDIIVGFPSETDADFEQLCGYLERSPLTHLHVFPYSDRPGTVASTMRDKVPGAVVRERGRRIRDIGQQLTTRFRESQAGTTHRALTLEGGAVAVTGNYLKVHIPPGRRRNEWIHVRIVDACEPLTAHVC
jgi:threonylcarbamoyladenosine tRNA methylthiotransferase MtaB